MKKLYLKMVVYAVVLLSSFGVKAQDDVVEFFQAAQADGGKLLTAYLNPMVEGISYGLNAGWFHTAKAHKPLGVDISFTVTPIFIPKSKDRFNPDDLGLSAGLTWENVDNPNANAPTIFGPDESIEYTTTVNNQQVTFTAPGGLGIRDEIGFAPVAMPMAQIGIGIIKGTDLKFRFVPKVEAGDSEINMFGIGVLHDVKQHIPGIKLLPFDLSAMVAYTSFKGVTDLTGSDYADPNSGGQEAEYKFNAFLIQALISKKISFLTVFGGIGYNGVKTTANVRGSYVFNYQGQTSLSIDNPYSGTFKNNSMRVDAGFRLNLLAFFLYGNYTLQEYSSVTAGFGFTFR